MATVTISLNDLHFIYRQLNYLRNYLGVYSSDPMEHVISLNPAIIDTTDPVPTEFVDNTEIEETYRDAEETNAEENEDGTDGEDETDGTDGEDGATDDTDAVAETTPVPNAPLITNFYGRLIKQMSYVLPVSPSKDSEDAN